MATTYALSPGSSHHPGPDLSVFFLQVTPHHDEAARGVGEGAGRGDGPACPAAALGVENFNPSLAMDSEGNKRFVNVFRANLQNMVIIYMQDN